MIGSILDDICVRGRSSEYLWHRRTGAAYGVKDVIDQFTGVPVPAFNLVVSVDFAFRASRDCWLRHYVRHARHSRTDLKISPLR